jgi:aldose 1-epimerase
MPVSAGAAVRVRPSVERAPFGELADGTRVERLRIRAGTLHMDAITYGAVIVALHTPDRDGRAGDVVLGFDTLDEYVAHSPYFGALIGRYGNRIARGRFTLDGTSYQLSTNDGENHLHGGVRGFDKMVWNATPFEREESAGVTFTRTSPDGEEGYPGTLSVRVDYTLSESGELTVDYDATTDRPTIVNLTQHSYFDLSGGRASDVGGHELTIHADEITPVGVGLIPTGELTPVSGTPFDFRNPRAIGARVNDADEQLRLAGGYDHNFVLAPSTGSEARRHAAHVREPVTGRTLDVYTSQPGLQFYSGNFLDGSVKGKQGRAYGHRGGFCLETQHYPDSPNHSHFPSVVLRPGATFRSRTTFVFGAERSAGDDSLGG